MNKDARRYFMRLRLARSNDKVTGLMFYCGCDGIVVLSF